MNIHDLREKQTKYLENSGVKSKEFKKIEKLRQEFIKKFPLKKINKLTLDEYVIGKGLETSFCYWIENKLNGWGDIHGSTANKFGIYFGKSGKDIEKKYRIGKSFFGNNVEDAFISVKKHIYQLINESDKIESLKKNPISPMFKGKILSLYFPNKF